ncbi:MAG: alkane 1-monooxygenase [Pseudomonadota bacterium]
MTTYRLNHPEKGVIEYTDKKRYLWMFSLLTPLFPMLGIGLYFALGSQWWLLTPLAYGYLLMPLLDWVVGSDENNPPEEIVPLLEEDRYYRILTWATAPMHFLVLIAMAWFVASQPLSMWSMVIVAVTAGMYSGLGINTAHELGHKKTAIEKWLAKVVLAVPAYGHFCVEHNRGHHVDVSTPEDPASSKMGENIYAFMLREVPGAMRRGWQVEKKRLESMGKSVWSLENDILQSYAITAILQGGLIIAFGWIMVPFLMIHNVWSWFQLTSANYIEHYGLLREKDANGRYERPKPHHSWNANYICSNLALFHLERHSDHHANPTRRYQSLRNFEDLPELPNGYYGMYMVAYIPWFWYKVMDKRVLDLPHINGDLSKVNILPAKREAIMAKYGVGDAAFAI